jgi:glutathione synthase
MKLLVVADPIGAFNIKKDSTYVMMVEAARRGHTLFFCEVGQISAVQGARIQARCHLISMTGEKTDWYRCGAEQFLDLADFDAVLMRKDPPFDLEFLYATHLLEHAERQGARVFNSGAALRNHPEKLAILEFPQFTAPGLVSRDMALLRQFHGEYNDVIYKPLDGMGGTGVFRAGPGERNLNVILETLTTFGTQSIMAQRFLPQISEGDKRILVIDGDPVPYCLARIPKAGETRGNLAAGGTGIAQPLSDRDRQIAGTLGPILANRGLLLVGLDVIGDCLTEINVTSPTCFQEIAQQTGCDVAGLFIDAVERRLVD